MRITGLAAPLQSVLLAALPKVPPFQAAEAPVPNAAPASAPAQPVSVEMLVALAASDGPIEQRRRIAAHADRGLRALESLNAAMLAGLPPVEKLQEIAAWTASREEAHDPAIAVLLQELELRMKVELAKHNIVI